MFRSPKPSCVFSPTILIALISPVLLSQPARGSFSAPQTSVTTTGGVSLDAGNTITGLSSGDLTKIFGNASFTSNGTDGQIHIDANGDLTAQAGDRFRVSYDFILSLGGGTADYTLTGSFTQTLPFPLPPVTLSGSDTGSAIGPQSKQFTGSFETPPIPIDVNGTYAANLVIDWTGAASGDTLNMTIPQHSIDLQVVAVPEPAILAIVATFATGALLRRHR